MSLRVYTVHLPSQAPMARTKRWQTLDSQGDLGPELVKEGFSWPAFLFGFVWALYHKLWLAAAALVALITVIGTVAEEMALGEISLSLIFFALAVLVGLMGNDWRRASLRRRGFTDGGVVTAPDMEAALRRYLDLRSLGLPAAPRPASPAAPQSWGTPDAGPWGQWKR